MTDKNFGNQKTASTDLRKIEIKKAVEAKTKSIDSFVK